MDEKDEKDICVGEDSVMPGEADYNPCWEISQT
jgi:hypothetical protein